MLPDVLPEDAVRYAEYLRNAIANYHPSSQGETAPSGFLSISGGVRHAFLTMGQSILGSGSARGHSPLQGEVFLQRSCTRCTRASSPLRRGRYIIRPVWADGPERRAGHPFEAQGGASPFTVCGREASSFSPLVTDSSFLQALPSALRSASPTGSSHPSSPNARVAPPPHATTLATPIPPASGASWKPEPGVPVRSRNAMTVDRQGSLPSCSRTGGCKIFNRVVSGLGLGRLRVIFRESWALLLFIFEYTSDGLS